MEKSIRAINIDFIQSQDDLDEVFKYRSVVRPKRRNYNHRARSMVLLVTRGDNCDTYQYSRDANDDDGDTNKDEP